MPRKLRPLFADDLDRLSPPCNDCAFWESAGERERRCGSVRDADTQRAWYRRVTDEWGSCGRVAFEDDEVLGFVKYAPSGYLPQSATFSAAPEDPSVPLLACLHIVPDARHRGLGTLLLRACMSDLVQRGERQLEAFAFTDETADIDMMPMLGMPFLMRNGFTVVRPDLRYPLLRLELKSLAVWQDNLESMLESLRFPLRVPKRVPASWTNER